MRHRGARGRNRTTKGFDVGVPQLLFPTALGAERRQFAVTKDGTQILVIVPEERSAPLPITVVVNWLATVQK